MQSWGAVGVALLVPLLSSVPATAQCAPGGTNLAGWWPGDNHAYNVINQRAATVQGTVTYAPGMVGDAFHFEGAGKVRIPEATSIDLSRTNRWTIMGWVKPSTLDGSASPLVYTEGNRVAALGLQKTSGKLVSLINGANPLESTVTLPANTWSHVAVVLDRTTRTLYVNGAAAGTAAATPATTADSTGSAIGGATTDDPAAVFQGDLDEITVHRRALTADEIAALYAAGSTGMCFGDGTPAFLLEPQPQTAPLFGEVTLTGLAMGSPRPTYQWLFNDSPLAGQTGFTLLLADLTPANNGVYKLVATCGAQSITSAGAQLTVQHCAATPDDLVAWWPADGNGLDFTGHHPGEVWGNVTFPEGLAGQSFGFDGVGGYLAIPDSPALSPHAGADGEMTVEAWVNLPAMPLHDDATAQDRRTIVGKGDPGRWEYGLTVTTTGVPEFWLSPADGQTTYASVAAGQLLTNHWHHLAAVLKKGQYLRLYQDGQLMAESKEFTGETGNGASPLYIGRRGDAQFLNGLVDEPAIYRRALSADEVAALYAGGSVGKCYGGGPKPVFVQEPADEEALLLNSVTLKGLALGTPRPAFQWYHNGSVVGGATNSALTLSRLSQADAGHYVLAASNQFGVTQSRTVSLTIKDYVNRIEGFELGWNGWSADDYSIWQVGQPSSGPGAAHSGTNCAATVLDGNHPENRSARLVSPAFTVPEADQLPRLRFWHWWSYDCGDYGRVEIKVGAGDWQALSDNIGASSDGQWSRAWLDLTPYAGKEVRLGFQTYATTACFLGYAPGWYIDDVTIETGPLPASGLPAQPDGFEGGWGGWLVDYIGGSATDFGIWEIGVPASGPGAAHSGTNCAATVLDGNHPENRSARLVSPAFTVPEADQLPRLRFWHWWSYDCGDYGRVEIKVGAGDWQALSDNIGASSDGQWSRAWLDLTPYAGKEVRLGFQTYATTACFLGYAPGWYIDDLMIQIGNIGLADVPDQQVDEKTQLSFKVNAVGADANSSLAFSLPWAPQGAWIDPETGVFSWTPSERQGPGVYNIPVYVVDYGNGEANEMTTVRVTVNEVNDRPWLRSSVLAVQPGQTLRFPLFAGDRDYPRNPLQYAMTGAPAGATLTPDTGVIEWAVPADATAATYLLDLTLTDNGSPSYTTNNTVTLTVTPNANHGLSIRPLGGSDFEFTIHDTTATDDYILQSAPALVDQAEWQFNGEAIPTWCSFVDVTEAVEWLTWDDFVQQHLQRTEWQDVTRVSPTAMPFTFTVALSPTEPMGLFRLVRVPR